MSECLLWKRHAAWVYAACILSWLAKDGFLKIEMPLLCNLDAWKGAESVFTVQKPAVFTQVNSFAHFTTPLSDRHLAASSLAEGERRWPAAGGWRTVVEISRFKAHMHPDRCFYLFQLISTPLRSELSAAMLWLQKVKLHEPVRMIKV